MKNAMGITRFEQITLEALEMATILQKDLDLEAVVDIDSTQHAVFYLTKASQALTSARLHYIEAVEAAQNVSGSTPTPLKPGGTADPIPSFLTNQGNEDFEKAMAKERASADKAGEYATMAERTERTGKDPAKGK